MFKFGKKEDKKAAKDDKKSTSSTTVLQKSSRLHSVETKQVTSYTTENYLSSYSVTQTGTATTNAKSLDHKNTINSFDRSPLSSAPNLNLYSPARLFEQERTPIRALSVFETDARPIPFPGQTTNLPRIPTNYQSPFSRHLPPYNSARLPTTTANSTARPTVQSPTTQSNNTVANLVPTYDTSGNKRGNVLVINNIKFLENKEERHGAEVDEKDVSKLFKDMGFDVSVSRNLKVSQMKSRIKKFSNDKSLAKVDISVVIIMSHGNNTINDKIVPGNFTQIFGSDGLAMGIDDVLAEFSGDNCAGMKGKPKIFIFQCCRGDQSEMQVDAAPIGKIIKLHADMLIAFSTLPGFYSIRNPREGSWYIQCICDVFKKHGKDFDVETLLKIVDDQLSRKHHSYKQTSTYESRGFKRCFLNPR